MTLSRSPRHNIVFRMTAYLLPRYRYAAIEDTLSVMRGSGRKASHTLGTECRAGRRHNIRRREPCHSPSGAYASDCSPTSGSNQGGPHLQELSPASRSTGLLRQTARVPYLRNNDCETSVSHNIRAFPTAPSRTAATQRSMQCRVSSEDQLRLWSLDFCSAPK